MQDDIKLPAGIQVAIAQTDGTHKAATVYTADQVRAVVAADREGRQQPIYGYHIVSEANGNGVAFCPADHAEEITAFLMAYPGTTIVPVVRAPADAQRDKGDGNASV